MGRYNSEEIDRYKSCLLRHQCGGNRGSFNPWGGQVFMGRRGQRGFGIFKGLFRNIILPTVKKVVLPTVKKVGRHLLNEAIESGKDVIAGKDLKQVVKQRTRGIVNHYLQDKAAQSGQGRRRKTANTRNKTKPRRGKKRSLIEDLSTEILGNGNAKRARIIR